MICPKCESEYIDGITVCPACGVELVSLEEFDAKLVNLSDWITVYVGSVEIEAVMLKDNLESAGIEAVIINKRDSNFPVLGDLSVIKIDVKKSDAREAENIIDDVLNRNNEET